MYKPLTVYPAKLNEPHPQAVLIKNFRTANKISLNEAAKSITVKSVELVDLENGRAVLTENDWGRAMQRLNGLTYVLNNSHKFKQKHGHSVPNR